MSASNRATALLLGIRKDTLEPRIADDFFPSAAFAKASRMLPDAVEIRVVYDLKPDRWPLLGSQLYPLPRPVELLRYYYRDAA